MIELLGVSSGLATIDADGDGTADDDEQLLSLGIDNDERRLLAETYPEGGRLWRVQISHFSAFDINWPFRFPPGAILPPALAALGALAGLAEAACTVFGSVIDCEAQTLGERFAIEGTPHALHYQSARADGYRPLREIDLPLTPSEPLPDSVKRIEVELMVAGRRIRERYEGAALETAPRFVFRWDGVDAFGRARQGAQPFFLRVGYVYDGEYAAPGGDTGESSFGSPAGVRLEGSRTREELTAWREVRGRFDTFDAALQGLGGLSLGAHHVFDPTSKTLYLGNGSRRSAEDIGWAADQVAGQRGGEERTGIPADEALLDVYGLAQTPAGRPESGQVYLSDFRRHRILRIGPGGLTELVAGTGTPGYAGDGGPAEDAQLRWPRRMVVAQDGGLLFVSGRVGDSNYAVRRIAPDGTISTIAGTGERADAARQGDGGLATDAAISLPLDIAQTADGAIWILCDSVTGIGRHLRVVSPGGRIQTVDIEDALGLQAITSDASGALVIADGFGDDGRIVRLGPDGSLRLIAGGGSATWDGGAVPNEDASLSLQGDLAVAHDGRIYVSVSIDARPAVVEIGSDGFARRIAGGGAGSQPCAGGPALGTDLLPGVEALAVASDGSVLLGLSQTASRVCRLREPFAIPGGGSDTRIPSSDGADIYVFDRRGRHLQTLDAMTAGVRWEFAYASGELVEAVDGDGRTSTFEREGGELRAIVGPYGHRTEVALGRSGGASRVASLTDPEGRREQLVYSDDGLLLERTDPRGGVHTYDYDARGRVVRDADPLGRAQRFVLENAESRTLVRSTPMGRMSRYTLENGVSESASRSISGGFTRVLTDPAGVQTRARAEATGDRVERADGSTTETSRRADPRFSLAGPYLGGTGVELPSGLSSAMTLERSAELDASDVGLSTQTLSVRMQSGGGPTGTSPREMTRAFDAALREYTTTSAEGRVRRERLDALGRLESAEAVGIEPLTIERDEMGRLSTLRQGAGAETRVVTMQYGTDGLLSAVEGGEGNTSRLERDAAGWVIAEVDGEGRRTSLERDAMGDLVALTRPGGARHAMTLDLAGQLVRMQQPEGAMPPGASDYTYSDDGELTQVDLASGRRVTFEYDDAGRIEQIREPEGTASFAYDETSGQLARAESTSGVRTEMDYDGLLLSGWSQVGTGLSSAAISHEFDDSLRVRRETVSVGGEDLPLEVRYDADDLLTRVGALSLSLDEGNGLLLGSALGTVTTEMAHNGFGEVELALASAGAARLYELSLERDLSSRIVRERTVLRGVSVDDRRFDFDGSGKLLAWRNGALMRGEYTYDARGLRTRTVDDRGSQAATYDSADRLLSFGEQRFMYDADGYLSRRTAGAEVSAFEHDAAGELRQAALPSGDVLSYRYDAYGRRVARFVDGTLEREWVFGRGLAPLAERRAASGEITRYVYASQSHAPDAMVRDGVTYRFVKDVRGSIRQVVDTRDGRIVQELDYDPWGRVLRDTNPDFQSFTFAGGLHDPGTELLRLGAREYDPSTGRFLTPDPEGFAGGDDLYGYAGDDPINFIDPAGRFPILAAFVAQAVFSIGCHLTFQGALTSGDLAWILGGAALVAGLGFLGMVAKFGKRAGRALPATRPRPRWMGRVVSYKKGAMAPLEHIFYRHGPSTGFSNVGRFADGTRARDVLRMVDEAARHGTWSRSGTSIVHDFGRQIGSHVDGSAATRLQVYLNDAGEVLTAFPMR